MSDPVDRINPHAVKVGQVWQSTDKRDDGKRITVLQVDLDSGRAQVQGFVKSWISLRRFRPNSTGYRLVSGLSGGTE